MLVFVRTSELIETLWSEVEEGKADWPIMIVKPSPD